VTEAEWLACEDPTMMVEDLRHKVSYRKLRWYAVACLRRLSSDRFTKFHWDVVQEVEEAIDEGWQLPEPEWSVGAAVGSLILTNAFYAARATTDRTQGSDDGERTKGREAQRKLLRDIFGNPFRLATFNPAWRTTDVMLLAQGIYDAKAIDRMPILADALQDAGCDNTDILTHCRDTSLTHVRGCWVVDLVLGKE
jgi:hypothetical protein